MSFALVICIVATIINVTVFLLEHRGGGRHAEIGTAYVSVVSTSPESDSEEGLRSSPSKVQESDISAWEASRLQETTAEIPFSANALAKATNECESL